ncbi:MAG: hypothetical protein RSD47_00770 [Romboutsia sp.]
MININSLPIKIGDKITIFEVNNMFKHIDGGIGLDFDIEEGALLFDDEKDNFVNIYYNVIEDYTNYNGLVEITDIITDRSIFE